MATKKKAAVSTPKVEVKKDYSYVSEFFKILNKKIEEVRNEQKEVEARAEAFDESLDTLRSIRNDMIDMFDEQGVPDVETLAGDDDDSIYNDRW